MQAKDSAHPFGDATGIGIPGVAIIAESAAINGGTDRASGSMPERWVLMLSMMPRTFRPASFLPTASRKPRKGRTARAGAIFGGVPDRVLRAQACKSAEQQVVVELLKQHPLALTYLFLLSHSTVLSTINRHGLPSNPASSWRNKKNRNACYLFRCTQSPPRDGGAHTFINLRLVFQTACPNPPREER